MAARKDIAGQQFGRLTVIRPYKFDGRHWYWFCHCSCGSDYVLKSGYQRQIQSCGCLNREATVASNTKHGGHDHPLYQTWSSMLNRCYNPKNKSYNYYGQRGIRVCDRWRFGENGEHGFECFLADMGPRPAGNSLDRINSSGNYEKSNCRWATAREQSNNRRPRQCLR